ncbi:MAG: acyl-CoA/acyl-ACP dehydrogenase [Acidimicrobiia bacterium]|nr:acyl-CoA/acyl-ACP dehydrogenase [Acidimicrobiia bacterium]MDH4307124.1 acyl-CoA/acyl-ACP dehydrogenase [Acidimicrobiia bacterium]
MSVRLSEDDLEIQARARLFVDEELIPWEVHAEMHDGELPEEVSARHEQRARELGLTAINQPTELGGHGYSTLQQVLIQEQAGRATNALGWVVSTPAAWFSAVATPFQLEQYVVPTIAGERHECYAITEEHAGSDVDAIVATARRDGDEYVLNGIKWHVTSANLADYVFFQAKLTDGPHAGDHALFIVDMDTPGVRHIRTPSYTHTYSHHHWEMAFEDVRVPASHLVGSEGDGMSFTYEWFRYERLMIAARCCGAAERLIEEAQEFAESRIVFGETLADRQAVQFMLADSLTELWAARLMTYETAREIDEGTDLKTVHAHCSMAKLYASEMAGRVADRAVQIFGGRGYMRENVAERFNRELRVDRIWEGASEVQRVIIAAQLRKRGLAPLTH